MRSAASSGGADSLGRHVGGGAYNSVNALALAAGGASLVDRSVVDVLGVAGAAQVLARRLHADLTPEEMDQVRQAMGSFHVSHYMQLPDEALREAREWHEAAHEIEIGEAATGAELTVAQELNAKRREFTGNAQRVLGTALGEMEANAALVVALEQPTKAEVQVSLGATPIEDAIRQARAIGLDRGDYQVERAGASTILTVTGGGMDKLAKPVSREDLARTRGALDIIEGRKDEDGWLPEGMARRPDMAGAIGDYIGGRAADGDAPADIMADLLSEDTLRKAGDRAGFMAALNGIAPLYGDDGKMVRVEAYQGKFDALADAFVAKQGGTLSPLHRQQIPVHDVSVGALHRALAEHPDGVAAFKPVGELTPQDQGGAARGVRPRVWPRRSGGGGDAGGVGKARRGGARARGRRYVRPRRQPGLARLASGSQRARREAEQGEHDVGQIPRGDGLAGERLHGDAGRGSLERAQEVRRWRATSGWRNSASWPTACAIVSPASMPRARSRKRWRRRGRRRKRRRKWVRSARASFRRRPMMRLNARRSGRSSSASDTRSGTRRSARLPA